MPCDTARLARAISAMAGGSLIRMGRLPRGDGGILGARRSGDAAGGLPADDEEDEDNGFNTKKR